MLLLIGLSLSAPFSLYFLVREGFSENVFLSLWGGVLTTFIIVSGPLVLCVTFAFLYIMKPAFEMTIGALYPREGERLLSWRESFFRAVQLLLWASLVDGVLILLWWMTFR